MVGQSGSGKFDARRFNCHVIMMLQGGDITIDGTSIKDVRIADLRSLIGNVNQEAILF